MLGLAVARRRQPCELRRGERVAAVEVVGTVTERGAGRHAGDLDRGRVIVIYIVGRAPGATLFPYTTLFRSGGGELNARRAAVEVEGRRVGDRGDVEVDRA